MIYLKLPDKVDGCSECPYKSISYSLWNGRLEEYDYCKYTNFKIELEPFEKFPYNCQLEQVGE